MTIISRPVRIRENEEKSREEIDAELEAELAEWLETNETEEEDKNGGKEDER